MLKMLSTVALIAGWSVLWFVKVFFLSATIGGLQCLNHQCDENLPFDFAIWVIGLVGIVAFQVWGNRGRAK